MKQVTVGKETFKVGELVAVKIDYLKSDGVATITKINKSEDESLITANIHFEYYNYLEYYEYWGDKESANQIVPIQNIRKINDFVKDIQEEIKDIEYVLRDRKELLKNIEKINEIKSIIFEGTVIDPKTNKEYVLGNLKHKNGKVVGLINENKSGYYIKKQEDAVFLFEVSQTKNGICRLNTDCIAII